MLTKNQIIKTLEKHKPEIKTYGVKKLGVFGSFGKAKQNEKSDIDFLVEFDEPTFDKYMDLKFFLERLFKRKVDLVVEETLKPALQYVKEEAIYVKGV